MADDNSSKPPGERRSWLDRLGQLFSGEPKNREDIIEILRAAREAGVLEAETLSMLEGAMAVSEGQVADVMVPRSQMVVLDAEAPLSEILAIVIESGHSRSTARNGTTFSVSCWPRICCPALPPVSRPIRSAACCASRFSFPSPSV
jgi:Mg2+/Co2+ transporter CorC